MTNRSLQKKSAARMAAVQCLYQAPHHSPAPDAKDWVAAVKKQLAGKPAEQKLLVGSAVEPHYPTLEAILSGVEERQKEIDSRLGASLAPGWTRARMSPLLVAILQCAIFELLFYKDASPKIVTDEYTRLTRHFFADAEVDFVHGALRQISQSHG